MEQVYKILLEKSTQKDGFMQGNIDDIREGFLENGYKEYCFGGFDYVYTKEELTEEERTKYEHEAKTIIDAQVDEITKDINKRILEDLKKHNI